MNKKHLPFWVITITAIIALILPTLIKDGMFMDGLLYATVAHNLANGIGTFWFPHYTQSQIFLEHPPLVYWLQSIFFRILGDSLYVERFYSFLTACITAYLITLIWKQIFRENIELRKLSWLPVFFWIIIPLTFYSYSNNLHENTMGIFTSLAVYFAIRGVKAHPQPFPKGREIKSTNGGYSNLITLCQEHKASEVLPFGKDLGGAVNFTRYRIFYLILSGLLIFLATLSKGLPGFFPVAIIFLYWLIFRNFSFLKMCGYLLILIFIPLIIYSLLLLDNEIFQSLSFYLTKRVFHRIQYDPTSTRFFTIQRLGMELVPVLSIIFILIVIFKLKSINLNLKNYKKEIFLYLLIGVSGSFPLMLTLVQKGFYFLPALPFYAIGLSIIVAPGLSELTQKINTTKLSFKIFKIFSFLLLLSSIVFSFLQVGKYSREEDKLKDIYLLGKIIPNHSTINIHPAIYPQWSVGEYFQRYFYIELEPSKTKQYEYFLIEKSCDTTVLDNYKKIELPTVKYNLYKREK